MRTLIAAFAFIACINPVAAMTKDDAAPACATAIDRVLRDPANAKYQFASRVVVGDVKAWTVLLPVRAPNAFGGMVTQIFVCRIEGEKVVRVVPR